jgi:succinate dehydrogenase/fumarate reductase flavoprotein subunit
MRTLDVMDILTCAQMIVQASKARKASSDALTFRRLDYPETDPPEWRKYIVIKREENGGVRVTDRPPGFWGDLASNYHPRHAENVSAMQRAQVSTAT